MKHEKGYVDSDTIGTLVTLVLFAVSFGAWITHLVVCFKTDAWGFLIAGEIFFPIGIIHGAGCWFGFW